MPVAAWAGGGTEVGGGGDAVILSDDTVVLADPYIKRSGKVTDLNPVLIKELQYIGHLLVRYGADMDFDFKELLRPQSSFLNKYVLSSTVEYHFVTEIPDIEVCKNRIPTNPDLKVLPIACTNGAITWILEDLFKKMSIREQAKTILHERLRAFPQAIPDEFIADITSGVETALGLLNELHTRKTSILTAEQIASLTTLVRRIEQAGLHHDPKEPPMSFSKNWMVFKNGGGLVHKKSKVSNTAYVSVGSIVSETSVLEAGSQLLTTDCYFPFLKWISCQLGPNATIENTLILVEKVVLKAGAKINDSNIVPRAYREGGLGLLSGSMLELGPSSQIINSWIIGPKTTVLERSSRITNVKIDLFSTDYELVLTEQIGPRSYYGDFYLKSFPTLQLLPDATVSNIGYSLIFTKPGWFSAPDIIFNSNVHIDLKGKPLCGSDKEVTKAKGETHYSGSKDINQDCEKR